MENVKLERVLDVRPILAQGGTPCSAIETAAAEIPVGAALVVLVPFEPVPLYDKLAHMGFSHAANQDADGTWRVTFRRERPQPTSAPPPACCCSGH